MKLSPERYGLAAATLFVAGIVVGLTIQMAIAQSANRGIVGLNHVGIAVPDLDAAITYYTETMGFPEAFRVTNDAGQPVLVYVQISRDTFVELQSVNPQRPAGLSHLGIEVEDMDSAVAMFRQRGAEVSDPRSGSTNAVLGNVTDLNGMRIELVEVTPDSLHRQAIDRWR